MRKLVILLGASASGKSTWIKNRHLEDYSLSADSIRKNFGYNTFSVVGDAITSIMNSCGEKPVWDIFFQNLESRMYS